MKRLFLLLFALAVSACGSSSSTSSSAASVAAPTTTTTTASVAGNYTLEITGSRTACPNFQRDWGMTVTQGPAFLGFNSTDTGRTIVQIIVATANGNSIAVQSLSINEYDSRGTLVANAAGLGTMTAASGQYVGSFSGIVTGSNLVPCQAADHTIALIRR